MKRLGSVLVVCLSLTILALAPPAAHAGGTASDPVSIVKDIYSQYSSGGQTFDVADAYFTEDLQGLWHSVEDHTGRSIPEALSFPVFTANSEDETIEVDDVRYTLISEKYVIATYVVLEDKDDKLMTVKKYFQYNFENTADGWKIRDIDWGRDKKTLVGYLNELKALWAPK